MEGTARPAMGMLCLLFLITLFPGQVECSRRRHPRRHRGGCSVPDPPSSGFIDHPPRTHVGPDLFVVILFRDGGCSVPDPPSNGFIDHPPRTHVSPGTMITYTCAEDHYMDLIQSPDYAEDHYMDLILSPDYGERYEYDYLDVSFVRNVLQYVRKCERNGTFSGLRITECKESANQKKVFRCELEAPPQHGYTIPARNEILNITSVQEWEDVNIMCNEGYGIVGTAHRICKSPFGWNDNGESYCLKIYCPTPQIEHGYYEPSRNTFYPEDEVKFFCFGGYELEGPSSLRCTAKHGWNSYEIPICRSFSSSNLHPCPDPGISPGSNLISSDDTKRVYTCDRRLHMEGDDTIYCDRETGTWSQHPPYCFTPHCFDTMDRLAHKIQNQIVELRTEQQDTSIGGRGRLVKHQFTNTYKNGTTPLTIYLVLDQSESMPQKDFDAAKLFMKELLNKLSMQNMTKGNETKPGGLAKVGLVVFATDATPIFLPYQILTTTEMKTEIEKLELTHTDSATNINAGLQKVIDAINLGERLGGPKYTSWKEHVTKSNKAIIMVTNGKFNRGGDPKENAKLLRDKYRYPIYIIGVSNVSVNPFLTYLVGGKANNQNIYILKEHHNYVHLVASMFGIDYKYTECGISDVKNCYDKNVHITNGNVTTNILFPWTVNIYHNDAWNAADKQKYIGGKKSLRGWPPKFQGTLIGNRWVLTAAHNWYERRQTRDDKLNKLNKLNDTSFLLEFSSDDGQGTIVRGVKKTFFRGYKFIEDIGVGDNDTMLIQLEGSLSFNKFRNPVCLPKPLAVLNQQFEPDLLGKYDDGKLGYVVGHDPTHGKMSSVCLPIRPCSYQGLHHGMFEEGPVPSLFCAGVVVIGRGSEVRDTDRGDSGSAFVSLCPDRRKEKKTDKRYVALGITSFNAMPDAMPTSLEDKYKGLGAYANVSFHMKWIEETITEAETNDGSK